MALADKLKAMKSDADDRLYISKNPQAALTEWVEALEILYKRTEIFLSSLVENNLLRIFRLKNVMNDEIFGTHEVPSLIIQIISDDIKVLMNPVARIVAGYSGRVDLFREYYASSDYIFRILRRRGSSEEWYMQRTPYGEFEKITNPLKAFNPKSRPYELYTKELLESVLEHLVSL